MSPKSHKKGAPEADPEKGSKREAKRAARRRAELEAKLASAVRLIEKRKAQLASASARRMSIAEKLARLPAPAGATDAPMAYCIKDRRHVPIGEAHVVVMANGRSAIAGLCPSCGSKVVRLGVGA